MKINVIKIFLVKVVIQSNVLMLTLFRIMLRNYLQIKSNFEYKRNENYLNNLYVFYALKICLKTYRSYNLLIS